MDIITTAQANYINRLREDKGWRVEFTDEQIEQAAQMSSDPAAFVASQHAAVEAYNTDLDGISQARASEIIDALKAW